ncbi:MAG TPA: MerR family transcriptional regulator [Ilumatobacteraceae bacterium]|nr:MerR family transcriptional regulator [Ilumatobacteraceae bacterium]
MTTAYRIKDIADRSGFTAATLRYYEGIGLLPESNRSPAGYRLYDDHTLDRLAFIARAKQLGCSLDEIADLTIAWDGGQCGPIQDRLREVVTDKLASARQQIVELMTLTSELQQAAATLELHRPDGPCDDLCGCVSEATVDTPESSQSVMFGRKERSTASPPIACTLASQSMRGRLDEWQALLAHATERGDVDEGVRVTFGSATPLDELIRLTTAEQDCCQFFNFTITVDTRGVALEVRAPADARDVLHGLFGSPA